MGEYPSRRFDEREEEFELEPGEFERCAVHPHRALLRIDADPFVFESFRPEPFALWFEEITQLSVIIVDIDHAVTGRFQS